MSALSRRPIQSPAASAATPASSMAAQAEMGNGAAQEALGASQSAGPFDNELLNGALSDAFGTSLDGIGAVAGADAQNEEISADATTTGTEMAFSSGIGEDETDGEAMEVVGHEVAHALAGGGTGEEAVGRPGDAGEAKAERAGQQFRAWAEAGFEGEAPSLAPAAGGEAEVHRHPTSAGPVLTGNPLLMWGSAGTLVKELQKLLRKAGQEVDVDGDFGPATHRAVVRFQAAAGLGADGMVGPNTARALNAGGQAAQQRAPAPAQGSQGGGGSAVDGDPLLRRGSSGSTVTELQKLLVGKGASIGTDGSFGGQTEGAVISFQLANGLAPDGQVGPNTARKLNDPTSKKIGAGGGNANGPVSGGASAKSVDEWRNKVLQAAEGHLGKRYYWGADGPNLFDCSGFILYVLRQNCGLVDWGDDTAAGIKGRVPGINSPKKGDLVFYSGSGGVSHIEMATGSGTTEIGASGGGSKTLGQDPNAKVQYGNMTADSRSRSYGSIQGLIEKKLAGNKA